MGIKVTVRIVCTVLIGINLLSACSTTLISNYVPYEDQQAKTPKKIALFLDGTANDQASRTNVSRLYELVTNRYATDVLAYYSEGVGTDGRFLGAITGLGVAKDVRDAYSFLSQHYSGYQDKIYIFGFSRGSYTARILAGFIFTAGLVDTRGLSKKERAKLVGRLYDAYKGDREFKVRQNRIQDVLDNVGMSAGKNANIELMGLWDTIEALGAPNFEENVGEVNTRYVDQICNINDKVYHAVSLDDNRARIYTPILMTGNHLNKQCPAHSIDAKVQEVWFSGAHADVGGGYTEGHLSGVSLNWMLGLIKNEGLLPKSACVFEDKYDVVHHAEGANKLYERAFAELRRKVEEYMDYTGYEKDGKKYIKVHRSAIDRIARLESEVQKRIEFRKRYNEKFKSYDSKWYLEEPYSRCFRKKESKEPIDPSLPSSYEFIGERCQSIEVVETDAGVQFCMRN